MVEVMDQYGGFCCLCFLCGERLDGLRSLLGRSLVQQRERERERDYEEDGCWVVCTSLL